MAFKLIKYLDLLTLLIYYILKYTNGLTVIGTTQVEVSVLTLLAIVLVHILSTVVDILSNCFAGVVRSKVISLLTGSASEWKYYIGIVFNTVLNGILGTGYIHSSHLETKSTLTFFTLALT